MAARTRATHIVAIGAVLAGLVLAGCAAPAAVRRTPTPEEALALVQGTAAKVTEARTARLSMTVRMIFAGEDVPANTATTVGTYDFAAHKGQMDTTMKAPGVPFRFTERTLVIGSAVYIKVPQPPDLPDLPEGGPPVPGELPGDQHTPWVKLELPKELAGGDGLGPGLSGFPGFPGFGPDVGSGSVDGPGGGSGDPTEALGYLKAASSKVEVVGEEQVRGAHTTRYAVTFDVARQAAQLPEEVRGLFEESGFSFPKPADVWVDDQGRLRKIHYAVTMKVPDEVPDQGTQGNQGLSPPMTVETTLELYDFGVEVHVAPPPASQVEVVRMDSPPPGCTSGKGKGGKGQTGSSAGSGSAAGSGSSAGAAQGSGQAVTWACAEPSASPGHSASTSP